MNHLNPFIFPIFLRNYLLYSDIHHKFRVFLRDHRTLSKYCKHILSEKPRHEKVTRYSRQGRRIPKLLHLPSNYHDRNYQQFIRIFSLQIVKQPIEIRMKDMFTFNHSLLKSVSGRIRNINSYAINHFVF